VNFILRLCGRQEKGRPDQRGSGDRAQLKSGGKTRSLLQAHPGWAADQPAQGLLSGGMVWIESRFASAAGQICQVVA